MIKERIIAYDKWDNLNDLAKMVIFSEVETVLGKRRQLWNRYSRGIDFTQTGEVIYADTGTLTDKRLSILLEKFIVDIASGYLSGSVQYDVDVGNELENKIGKLVFDKKPISTDDALELRYIIDTIASQNSDATELTSLFRDALLYGCCYERIIDDKDNGYQYYSLDGLNTVGLWTDDAKPKLMAVIQAYRRRIEPTGTYRYLYRVYLKDRVEIYSRESKSKEQSADILKKDSSVEHNWGRVPVVVYESQFSILDKGESVIAAYETLLNNVKNTYKYNAEDCKMKIAGYRPQNPITIPNPDYDPDKPNGAPQTIINPARIQEDNAILAGKTFYVQEGGDANWLIKPVQANDVTTLLKFYLDTIFQLCGIPNTSDLAFNSSDLNASAIDRKFYIMNIVTAIIREGVEKLIRGRFDMFLNRINIKHNTNYDINNVRITINTNLPSMTDENIDQMLRLDGILSEETILEKLGYDFETEHGRKEKEVRFNAEILAQNNPTMEQETQELDENGKPVIKVDKTDTITVQKNRLSATKDTRNVQNNMNREKAEKVKIGTTVGSPAGHQNRGRK